ncbi:hypothetical protein, partial [Klebsiella sp. GW_Kp182]|uniref:hypothetical protein n=1 Tax=Klebsiella sp. GW_Kp182 TaxID=3153493 RepID=UPI0032B42D90
WLGDCRRGDAQVRAGDVKTCCSRLALRLAGLPARTGAARRFREIPQATAQKPDRVVRKTSYSYWMRSEISKSVGRFSAVGP